MMKISKKAFGEIKRFIYSDIQREINLARFTEDCRLGKVKIGKRILEAIIDIPGGGNFLAALGLLCYTEFAGKIKYNMKKLNGKALASENFNKFFDDLGKEYKSFRKSFTNKNYVYDTFRCGLAHEYHVKKSCTIFILKGQEKIGIGKNKNGRYFFVIERYFEDFKKAFDNLEKWLYCLGDMF